MVQNFVNANTEQAFAAIPRFLDFVFHPTAVRRLSADEDDGAGPVFQLRVDPTLNSSIAERYGLAFYDACIVAAASIEGCHALYTEDMHHGLIIEESLTLRNPFA